MIPLFNLGLGLILWVRGVGVGRCGGMPGGGRVGGRVKSGAAAIIRTSGPLRSCQHCNWRPIVALTTFSQAR